MTAASLIASMATDTIIISRPAIGSYVNGDYIEGPVTTITVNVVVYPASGDDLLRLGEGFRNKETIKIISPIELQSGSAPPQNLRQADVISFDGNEYEATNVMRWRGLSYGNAWEVLAVRKSE